MNSIYLYMYLYIYVCFFDCSMSAVLDLHLAVLTFCPKMNSKSQPPWNSTVQPLKPFWLELGYEIACFCHSNSRLGDWFNHGTGQVVLLHCVLYPPCTEYWKWDGHTLPVEGSLFPGQRWRDPAETNSLSLWCLANAWWTAAAYAFCRWTGAQGPDGRDCNPKARDLDPDEWEGYQRIGMQDARSGHRSADGGPGSSTAASCGRSDPGPTASPYRTSIGPNAITDSFHADRLKPTLRYSFGRNQCARHCTDLWVPNPYMLYNASWQQCHPFSGRQKEARRRARTAELLARLAPWNKVCTGDASI